MTWLLLALLLVNLCVSLAAFARAREAASARPQEATLEATEDDRISKIDGKLDVIFNIQKAMADAIKAVHEGQQGISLGVQALLVEAGAEIPGDGRPM